MQCQGRGSDGKTQDGQKPLVDVDIDELLAKLASSSHTEIEQASILRSLRHCVRDAALRSNIMQSRTLPQVRSGVDVMDWTRPGACGSAV